MTLEEIAKKKEASTCPLLFMESIKSIVKQISSSMCKYANQSFTQNMFQHSYCFTRRGKHKKVGTKKVSTTTKTKNR